MSVGINEITSTGSYKKANALIAAKYSGSVMEEYIMSAAIKAIRQEEDGGQVSSMIKTMDLFDLMGVSDQKGGALYVRVNEAVSKLSHRQIYIESPDRKRFELINVFEKIVYDNGQVDMLFTNSAKPYLADLTSNYTLIDSKIMFQFKSAYTMRLYEFIKSKSYFHKGEKKDPNHVFKIEVGINELKFTIGAYNINEEDSHHKKILATMIKNDTIDYDKAEELLLSKSKNSYSRWTNFKTRILDKSVDEINTKTDIHIDWESTKSGRGGKVISITFYVKYINDQNTDNGDNKEYKVTYTSDGVEIVDDNEKIDRVTYESDFLTEVRDEVKDIIGTRISVKDARAVAEASDWNIDKIHNAIGMLKSASGKIDNVIGWLISAIKKEYTTEGVQLEKLASKRNSFLNFKQRDNDYEKLQTELLKIGRLKKKA